MVDEAFAQRLCAAALAVFANRRMLAAYAHGSRISGTPRGNSDLDIGYYLADHAQGERLSLRDEMLMATQLSEALDLEVDLRDLSDAPLELRGRVLEEGLRIFSGDASLRVGLERDLLGRYHDYKFEIQQMHDLRLRRFGERGF